ncbi:unnamed protein product [Coregonus sp. 'balchen']|nr:unnamed protein product [Coregonus sp. 'balchen']
MRLTSERSRVKMAAGSDLLDDVFFNTEVDEKVVSDLVGSLESELTGSGRGNSAVRIQAAANHIGNSNVQDSKMGLSQELAKPGTSVQGGVINSTRSTMDIAAGTTAAGSSMTAGHSQSKTGTAGGVLTVVPDHREGIGKTGAAGVCAHCHAREAAYANPRNSHIAEREKYLSDINCQRRPPCMFRSTSQQVGDAKNDHTNDSTGDGDDDSSFREKPGFTKCKDLHPIDYCYQSWWDKGDRASGMVLVRSESGQLLMIHQQTLAQMQAQSQSQSAMTPRPATPTSTPPVQITSVQAPGMPLMARQVTPTTVTKQGSPAQSTVQATTTLQRPPVLQQNTIMLGGAAATPSQAPVQPGSAAAAVTQRAGTPGTTGTPGTPTTITETLENVKKCKNFLSTLIKLASSGKQSSETTASVKDLVKSLLEGKIEAEEFTSRLYRELNSSPQPYLVPFLKRSLPALRQMTPDSTAFIQQSQLPQASAQPASSSTALTSVVLGGTAAAQRPPLNSTTSPGAKGTLHQSPVISLAQTPHSKPGLMVPQQQGAMASPQVTLAQAPMVTLRGQPHSRIMGQPQVVKQLQTVPVVKQALASGAKGTLGLQSMLSVAQKNKLKEASGGTFKDDDDINDVASMAGVNLSEESARILATNSELVGAVTRSCKDEAFLYTSSLTRRVQEIGEIHATYSAFGKYSDPLTFSTFYYVTALF